MDDLFRHPAAGHVWNHLDDFFCHIAADLLFDDVLHDFRTHHRVFDFAFDQVRAPLSGHAHPRLSGHHAQAGQAIRLHAPAQRGHSWRTLRGFHPLTLVFTHRASPSFRTHYRAADFAFHCFGHGTMHDAAALALSLLHDPLPLCADTFAF